MSSLMPNTTQTPNLLYDVEMQKMKDTELRIVMTVIRKTLGWIEDPETGMRKKEDWLSQSQLIALTNRSQKSVTSSIDTCIKNSWIEARNEAGDLLDTADKRQQIGRGGKIFYRLGEKFMGKPATEKGSKNYYPSQEEEKKGSKNYLAKITKQNLHTTKETELQNKPINKNTAEAEASVIKRNVDNSVDNRTPNGNCSGCTDPDPLGGTHCEGTYQHPFPEKHGNGIKSLGDVLQNHQLKIPESSNGINHEFQAEALRYWQELGLKGTPTRNFFQHIKLAFKNNKQGRLQTALSYCKDAENVRDREKLFYWRFANEPGKAGAQTHAL